MFLIIILFFQDYFKLLPEGFKPEDVYVCESRYTTRTKTFKKIKMWSMPPNSVKLIPRDVPLPVVRVASLFVSAANRDQVADTSDDHGSFIEKVCIFMNWQFPVIFRKINLDFFQVFLTDNSHTCYLQEREAVPVEVANGEPGCQYYEQLCYNNMWLKVGDCVYIRSHVLIRPRIGRQANYKYIF